MASSRTLVVNFVGESSQLDATLKKQTDSFSKLGKSIVSLGASYLGFSAAKSAIDNTEQLGESVLKLHDAYGLTIKQATAWDAAIQARGGSTQSLTTSFKTLSTQVVAAANGSAPAIKAFADLGITQEDLVKHGNNLSWVLSAVSNGLSKLPAGTQRGADASKLLGKTYAQLIPIISGGSAEMQKQLDLVAKSGVVFSGGSKGIEQLRNEQIAWNTDLLGLETTFTSLVAPALLKFGADALGVVNDLRPFKTEVEIAGGIIASALAYKKIKGGVVELGGDLKTLVTKMLAYSIPIVDANETVGTSFTMVGTDASGATIRVESASARAAAAVKASSAEIVAANERAAGSFAATADAAGGAASLGLAGTASRVAGPAALALTAVPLIGHFVAPQLAKVFGGNLNGIGASVPGFTGAQFNLPGGANNVNQIKTLQDQLNGVKSPMQRSIAQWKDYSSEVTKLQHTLPDMTSSQRQGFAKLQTAISESITALQKYEAARTAHNPRPDSNLGPPPSSALNVQIPPGYRQSVAAGALGVQTTRITDRSKIGSDAAAAHASVLSDMSTLASQQMQAAAQHLSDAATIVQAKFSAAATKIDDAATIGHDQAQLIVAGMTDATQVQTDKLAERGLYGNELLAQKLTVQSDILKLASDRSQAIQQKIVDQVKAHWDGTIAADQTKVAIVTAHQDHLNAVAQQKATQVQLNADTLLGNATNKADTTQLSTDIATALAQQEVTRSASGTKKQQAAAAAALTLTQAQGSKKNALAAQTLGNVTATTNTSVAAANSQYQNTEDAGAKKVAAASLKLSKDQGAAQVAEARENRKLGKLQDVSSIAEARLQSKIAVAQAGPSKPVKIKPLSINFDPKHGGSGAAKARRSGGLTINGGLHVNGSNKTPGEIAHATYLAVRPLFH